MESQSNIKIYKEKLLLVEGKDEINFFRSLLDHMQIREIQVEEIGGKDKFKIEFPTLLLIPGFENLKSISIVRDADTNAKSAFDSVVNVLKKNNQAAPDNIGTFRKKDGRKYGIFILPGGKSRGMLETLCLELMADHPALQCVDDFFECLTLTFKNPQKHAGKIIKKPRNSDKSKMKAFLASLEKDVPSLGVAACKGYINFECPNLNDLKKFIAEI